MNVAGRAGTTAIHLALLGAITVVITAQGVGLSSALRHLYLVPVLWAALIAGSRGGGLMGLVAGLLQAPLALPAIERLGFTSQTVDGLVSMATPLAFGWVTGRLVDQSRARILRLRGVLEVQRSLSRDAPLEESLRVVAERVRMALGADRVGLVVGEDAATRAVVSAPPGAGYDERSAAAWSLSFGRDVWVNDLGGDARFEPGEPRSAAPVRGLVLPLDSGSGLLGVLAIERTGDLSVATRVQAQEIAVHLALGIESVRMALRKRRFAAELEAKVAAATERLRELDRAKTEFLSVVAHELRTPLTALQGFSELLLLRTLPPERARRFLGHVHGEAQRLGRIVAELLDISRIEAGRSLELRRERIDLNEVMERNVELFAAEHRRHCFEWTPCAGSFQLEGDRDAVDRMLKNLLSNAVKYSPHGGRVVVSAGPALDHADMIELCVEDEGIGIPVRHLGRIFDKYVRIPHPATAAARGLGLGLCLVKALAEAHGGQVEVDSLPGKGSRFRLLLPALVGTVEPTF